MSPSPRLRLVPTPTKPASSIVTVVTPATVQGAQPTTVRTLYPVTGDHGRRWLSGLARSLVVDRAALDSFTHAWRQAADLADGAFVE